MLPAIHTAKHVYKKTVKKSINSGAG